MCISYLHLPSNGSRSNSWSRWRNRRTRLVSSIGEAFSLCFPLISILPETDPLSHFFTDVSITFSISISYRPSYLRAVASNLSDKRVESRQNETLFRPLPPPSVSGPPSFWRSLTLFPIYRNIKPSLSLSPAILQRSLAFKGVKLANSTFDRTKRAWPFVSGPSLSNFLIPGASFFSSIHRGSIFEMHG